MKNATKKQIESGRKVYMNLSGICFTHKEAIEYYGVRFDTSILAKVVLNEDGDVIGNW